MRITKVTNTLFYTCSQNSSMIIKTISSCVFHGLYIAQRSQAVMTSDITQSLQSKEHNYYFCPDNSKGLDIGNYTVLTK